MTSTGWTWDYIAEHVDVPRLLAINKYWDAHPPVHLLVAGYMGYEPKQNATSLEEAAEYVPVNTVTAEEFEDILKQHGLPTGK